MTIPDNNEREAEIVKCTTNLLVELEAKLKQNFFEPDQAEGVRFCVSQIILKAIALAKNPKVETVRIKDMYDLALEILAQGDLKTQTEEKRLTDLINAMVEQDDINLIVKSIKTEQKLQYEALMRRQETQFNLLNEQLLETTSKVEGLSRVVSGLSLKSSTLHIFFVTLVTLTILLFTIVTAGSIIAYLLTANNQPDIVKKESFFQKESFDTKFASELYKPKNSNQLFKNIILYDN